MIFAGIDAGSRALKAVLWDRDGQAVLAAGTVDQGLDQERLARELFERLLAQARLEEKQIAGIVATGYGRQLIRFANRTITEISCHACGVRYLAPEARTVIEIGGQDSKLIRLDGAGNVRDFAMNDRCAAGTGRFLEVVAVRLGMSLPALGELAQQSRAPTAISSMCVVFAETEIIGLLASGASPADIIAGVQASVASRMLALAGQRVEAPVFFTGGVALIPGMASALEKALGCSVSQVAEPLLSGALGAAILAARVSVVPSPRASDPV